MQLKKINFEKLYQKMNAGLELLTKIDEQNDFRKECNMREFDIFLPVISKQINDFIVKDTKMNEKQRKISVESFEKFARMRLKKLDLTEIISFDKWNELFNEWAGKHLDLCILASNITITSYN